MQDPGLRELSKVSPNSAGLIPFCAQSNAIPFHSTSGDDFVLVDRPDVIARVVDYNDHAKVSVSTQIFVATHAFLPLKHGGAQRSPVPDGIPP